MKEIFINGKLKKFYPLKITKKLDLTKNIFSLELDVPQELASIFAFRAGQYVSLSWQYNEVEVASDFSMTNTPFENKICLCIKSTSSKVHSLYLQSNEGASLLVSVPEGRFVLDSKPDEFRTLVFFAGGIGITPIMSHLYFLLESEPRTRMYLFWAVKMKEDLVFSDELGHLQDLHKERLSVHYFFSEEPIENPLYKGRIDEKKFLLIKNQLLHEDDTDEESTLWDAVDEVFICGKGEMIKTLANVCYKNGIPKENIHFELFEVFDESIYSNSSPENVLQNITVEYGYNGIQYKTILPNNKEKILPQLLEQKMKIPYSCKSGICGLCMCQLEEGTVELLENEYLTAKEESEGKVLVCSAYPTSSFLKLNFDTV